MTAPRHKPREAFILGNEAVAEGALAHAVGSEVRRAYQRSDLLEKRRALMSQWADYCQSQPASVAATAKDEEPKIFRRTSVTRWRPFFPTAMVSSRCR